MKIVFGAACALGALGISTSASAQDATPAAAAQAAPVAPTPASAAAPAPAASPCELHVWPTENYIGINTSLLSGFGVVGALADVASHENRVKTVKDQMREYLGPDVQLEELNKIGLLQSLKLPAETRIVVEEPTPFNEDLKNNPELKAKTKAMNETLKAGKRLTASQSPCYSELFVTFIFYQKATFYGTRVFTSFVYRNFKDQPLATKPSTGMVENSLKEFPPKSPETVEAAKADLRGAFSKDFLKWLEIKWRP